MVRYFKTEVSKEIKPHFSCFSSVRAEGNQFDVQIDGRIVTISASGAENAQKQWSLGNVSDLGNRKEPLGEE